jgi:hypothetical protein
VSLTTREACAVNDVLTWFFGRGPDDTTPPPSATEFRDGVAVLAGVAHRKIGSGWTLPQAVRAASETLTANEFAARVARAVIDRCDGDGLAIDGVDAQSWAADRPDEPDIDDELIVTHPSGRQMLVRIQARVVAGSPS